MTQRGVSGTRVHAMGRAQRACAGEVYASCVDGQDEAARKRTEGTLGTRRSGREGVGWRRHVNDTTSETDSPPIDTPPDQRSRWSGGVFAAQVSGGCGIRTHEDITALPVFKTSAIGH